MLAPRNEKVTYDSLHDVLYIFWGEPRFGYEDEVSPGIFLRKADDTDEVIGVVIMGFKKTNKQFLQSLIPMEVDLENMLH